MLDMGLLWCSGAQEVEQGGVDLIGVCPGDGVRAALDPTRCMSLISRAAAGGSCPAADLVRAVG